MNNDYFEFEINDNKWTIEVVSEDTMNNRMKDSCTLGVTIYKPQQILLVENQANIVRTLKHELMHVWLYEYGHSQTDETTYDYEDICEIVASSNNYINKTVSMFLDYMNQRYSNEIDSIVHKTKNQILAEEVN